MLEARDLYVVPTGYQGMQDPIGVSGTGGRFTWNIRGKGRDVIQQAYRLQIAREEDFREPVYDKTWTGADTWCEVELELAEKQVYFWRVCSCVTEGDKDPVWLPWSDPGKFETGLFGEDSWQGEWIEADEDFYRDAREVARDFWESPDIDQGMRRCVYLRRTWELAEAPVRARSYVTAHGFYELRINGRKAGKYALAPDFTAYDKCLYCQTYDITGLLHPGENQVEVVLADGWYAGHAQGIPGRNHLYGERPALLMQAEAQSADGRTSILASDDTFRACTGPLLYADLFMGEYLDQTQDSVEYGTVVCPYPKDILVPQEYEGIQEKKNLLAVGLLPAAKVWQQADGSWIVDYGQVLAGRERIRFCGEAGSLVKIEHSEVLDPATGDIMRTIQRFPNHSQTDTVRIVEEDWIYEPSFSFQGFRYLKISGLVGELVPSRCACAVLETAMTDTCAFHCSHEELDRLVRNAYWSQCGNMISIPTDCPQRERGGFTGDAQIFCRTAAWNQDVLGFFRRWLGQCRLEQLKRGQIPIVVPYTDAYRDSEPNPGWTSAGWGDAIIFVPLDLYHAYGCREVLQENYSAMERWMDYVTACAQDSMPEQYYMDFGKRRAMQYLWNTGYHWGDWLMPGYTDEEGVACSKEITASLFYYRQAVCMEEISHVLEESGFLEGQEHSSYYRELAGHIRDAFHQVYLTKDGKLTRELQGLYVMAIAFGMVQGTEREIFAGRLEELVKEAGYHLGTGFLSTPFLLDVLWECGLRDTAYRVLYQDTYPSWLYEVKKGATTIWEHWDEIREDGSVCGGSFNHYAFGCIADFIYRRIGGITSLVPGFREVLIQPEAVRGITYAELSYQTQFGWFHVRWDREEAGIRCQVTIPPGMCAWTEEEGNRKRYGSGVHVFLLPLEEAVVSSGHSR